MRTKTYRPFTIEHGKVQRNYSSVQLNLPVALANEIISWGYKTIPERSIFSDPDKPSFGREDNAHITVLYGIETAKNHWFLLCLKEESLLKLNWVICLYLTIMCLMF